MPKSVHLDFETYSATNLKTAGMFRYAECPTTEILILAYSVGKGPVVGVDLSKGPESHRDPALHPLFDAIQKGLEVTAHNAQFERIIWDLIGHFPVTPHPMQWNCTAARARMIAIPGALDGAAAALNVPIRKDKKGADLIELFSKPNKKTGVRTYAWDRPEEFEEFIDYCRTDVKVEKKLDKLLPQLSSSEARCFDVDYRINKRGLPVNMELVDRAHDFVAEYGDLLNRASVKISGYRPTQRERTMEWLESQGLDVPNLQAPTVEKLAEQEGLPQRVRDLLSYRIETSRAGTKKLAAIQDTVSSDGRVRGGFMFSAASTRRWSSTGVQLHNLQKPESGSELEALGKDGPLFVLKLIEKDPWLLLEHFERPLSAIAMSIRGFFEAEQGKVFDVADYSSVEPRGLAWMANEKWQLRAYRNGEDLYRITAGKVYGKDWRTFDKEGPERFMGKQLVLGCGYGMGPPRFIETVAKFGRQISLDESNQAVYGYRDSVPEIIRFWKRVNKLCIKAVRTGKTQRIDKLAFRPVTLKNGIELLFVDMPSGSICYPKPSIGQEEWRGRMNDNFEFWTVRGKAFFPTDTFGGSITENIIQALTRDILRDGMVAAYDAGHDIVGHVHDEALSEADEKDKSSLKDFQYRLSRSSKWAKGFPIETEGFRTKRYKK